VDPAVIIGLIGAILAALVGAWATVRAAKRAKIPPKSEILLANFSIERPLVSGRVQSTLLDFTVRNVGGQPALISGISINCIRWMNFEYLEAPRLAIPAGEPLSPSMTLGVDIPLVPAPFTVTKRVSERVAPNELERFIVACSLAQPGGTNYTLYALNCDLILEGGDAVVRTRNFIIGAGEWLRIPPTSEIKRDVHAAAGVRVGEVVAYVEKRVSQFEELEALLTLSPMEPSDVAYTSISRREVRAEVQELRELVEDLKS
jgi:hypothetical protein